MGPVNTIEMIGCYTILMGNFFINLLLFGNLMVIVDYFIQASLDQQEMVDGANEIMQAIDLPYDERILVNDYFKKT